MVNSLLKRYRDFRQTAIEEFYLHIVDLLEHQEVQDLNNYMQHHCYSRLKHSLDVAYLSFFIAKLLGWDARSTARGGLLHDLFLYDWRGIEDCSGRQHAVGHPKVAVENAKKLTALNPVEENIIRRHMWLMTLVPPRYKEGYIVTFVDKYCALWEFIQGVAGSRPATLKMAVE